jgi:hypothetical protein
LIGGPWRERCNIGREDFKTPTTFCTTKDDLLRKYNDATLEWSQLANKLLETIEAEPGISDASRQERLARIETARQESLRTKAAYEDHIAVHGCNTRYETSSS